MFLQYYGLREQPFGMTPDPRYLYLSGSHREALASLIYGIETGRGFVSLIAEPGMGKTTLLFQLMEQFRNSARTVFLFQTQGDTREFLSNLISDLGLVPDDRDVSSLQRQLNEILIQEARLGRQFVLVIDEAQNLDIAVLESVRMLSNFETSRSKLMQIVLAGQPPLANKLARPELEQLMQRVSIICRLDPFTREEVVEYINHRLKAAGYKGRQRFTPEALSMIADLSEGIPRNINNICFHALSLGYAKGQKKIDDTIIGEVVNDLDLETLKYRRQGLRSAYGEMPKPVSGLEGVTVNADKRGQPDNVPIRGGRYSPLAAAGTRGVGRPRRRPPRWAFGAIALLTLVMAGQMFWADLPAGARRQVVTQIVTKTVGKVREVAARFNLLKANDSPDVPEPQSTVVHSGTKANDIPEPLRESASVPTDPANIDPLKADSPAAGNENAMAANDNLTAPPTGPVSIPVRAAPKGVERKSTDDPGSTEQGSEGKIIIESNVAGSAITINGQTNPGWRTPHMFDLPPGMYRISVSQEGYSTWFREVRVTSRQKRWVTADLHLPRGLVVIETEPPGMRVFIDGKAYGPSEVRAALNAGLHKYKVIPPGDRRPLEGSFVLKPGDVLTRKIRWLQSSGQSTAVSKRNTRELQNKDNSAKAREQS